MCYDSYNALFFLVSFNHECPGNFDCLKSSKKGKSIVTVEAKMAYKVQFQRYWEKLFFVQNAISNKCLVVALNDI